MAEVAPSSVSAHETEATHTHNNGSPPSSIRPEDKVEEPTPDPGSGNQSATADPRELGRLIRNFVWNVVDTIVLFRLASIYLHRFDDFEGCDHPEHSEEREKEVTLWRKEQQKEWDRLSTTVSFLRVRAYRN